ncbi:type IV pilus modification protein PilV [Thiobacillus sp.]|uniref:type IV pilus modification protein PilV n=1 Tax=Thiobacillus sp. TaxID=924 RepID=UPI0025F0062B|nr:type IV pilus modification protein PilV [Thiobacillus sp.]
MHKQNGFTLLEVLVTLLIVSLGLLGIAGIIANSLKVNQGAYIRSQASLLANDIIDRMRANRTTAETSPSPYALASCAAAPGGATVAQTDLKQWCDALIATMPSGSGTGSVTVGAAPAWKITVVVQWNDSRAGGSSAQQFTVETRL